MHKCKYLVMCVLYNAAIVERLLSSCLQQTRQQLRVSINTNQLSHIYDILFAPKLSGERRLDRPFRRRLQSKPKRHH